MNLFRCLTDRQADVLRLVCASRSDEQIAAALGIARLTVRHHRYQIRQRLAAPDREICRRHEAEVTARLHALRERLRAEQSRAASHPSRWPS